MMDISKLGLNKLRNLVIGGSFENWQRTISSTATNVYAADRFLLSSGNITTLTRTVARSSDVPAVGTAGFGASRFSWQYTVGTAEASPGTNKWEELVHRLEGHVAREIYGRTFTLSFWVKASIAGQYSVFIRNAANDRSYVAPYTINAANTWEKKTVTLLHNLTGTWPVDASQAMFLGWAFLEGTDYQTGITNTWISPNKGTITGQVQLAQTAGATFRIAEVMINEGAVAAPFVPSGGDLNAETALCYRYYETDSYDTGFYSGSAAAGGDSGINYPIYFKVQKRAVPTVARTGVSFQTANFSGAPGASDLGLMNTTVHKTVQKSTVTGGGSSNHRVTATWTADAEL